MTATEYRAEMDRYLAADGERRVTDWHWAGWAQEMHKRTPRAAARLEAKHRTGAHDTLHMHETMGDW